MLITRRVVKRTFAKVIRQAKKLKKINVAYNNVTTPITFCEISFEDVPDCIPNHRFILGLLYSMPQFNALSSCYDTFSIDKDMLESITSVLLSSRKFMSFSSKNKLLYICKGLCLLYKMIIYNTNLHAYHNAAWVCLDYLNFVVSCLD